MRKSITMVAVIAILTLVAGVLPASAHSVSYGAAPSSAQIATDYNAFAAGSVAGTGHGWAQATLSPNLAGVNGTGSATNGYPCGQMPWGGQVAGDAVNRGQNNSASWADDLGRYTDLVSGIGSGPCLGDVNNATSDTTNGAIGAGQGTTASGKQFAVTATGKGAFDAEYNYSEPCQTLPNGTKEAATGEAIGYVAASFPAAVVYDGVASTGNVETRAKFWWSRAGLTAVIVLKDFVTNLPGSLPTVRDTAGTGIGVAAFLPESTPNCGSPIHPQPFGNGTNGILIVSGMAY